MEKKKTPAKMKPRFKDGTVVWDNHLEKKVKYKHERDRYKFHLSAYVGQDSTAKPLDK